MSYGLVNHGLAGGPLKRGLLGVGILAASFALIACTDDAAGDGTPTATASGATATSTPDGSGDAPHEVDSAACDEIAPEVEAAFPGIALIEDSTAYEAGGGALVGEGCRVMVRGTAEELPTFVEVATTLRGILEARGWTEDMQYAADGPAGTIAVFTDAADGIAVLAASTSPSEPTVCPPDQIIGECLDGLDPSQVIVQGEIVVGLMPQQSP